MKYLKNIFEEAKSIPTYSQLDEVNNFLLDLKDLGCVCEAKEFFMDPTVTSARSPNGLFGSEVFDYINPENYFNSSKLNAVRTYIIYVTYEFSNLETNSEIAQEMVILENRLKDKFSGCKTISNLDVDDEMEEGYKMVYRICVMTSETLKTNKVIFKPR